MMPRKFYLKLFQTKMPVIREHKGSFVNDLMLILLYILNCPLQSLV